MASEESWLRQVPYFSRLPDEDLRELGRYVHSRRYEHGEVIILEGEECKGLYIVQEGQVRIFKMSPSGKEQVLRLMQPFDSFNDVPVFDGGLNPASADALNGAYVALLAKKDATHLLRTRPAFAESMLRIFALRLRHLTALVEDLSFHHVRSRLARALLQTAADGKVSRATQRQLADMVGTAREVASREFRHMEAQGLIRIGRGWTEILNAPGLQRLAMGQ